MRRIIKMNGGKLVAFVYLVHLVAAQDTMFADDNYDDVNDGIDNKGCNCLDDLIKIDEMVKKKLINFEKRLMSNMDYKNRQLSKKLDAQTQINRDLEHELRRLRKEVNRIKKTDEKQQENLQTLRQHLHQHKSSIDTLNMNNAGIKLSLENISTILGNLQPGEIHVSTSSPVISTPRSKETTTEPYNSLFPRDCQDVYDTGGMRYPGDYYIMLQPKTTIEPFKACCRMTNESGWTVIQRRQDGSIDFFQDWASYKNGFGNLEGEFWLGNDHIHELTSQGNYKLRIDMEDWDGHRYFSEYDSFMIDNEDDLYRLHIRGYHGNAGDSLTPYWDNHNNQPFSTKDMDNDERYYDNCAEHYHGAWWFKSCFKSHLNGIYYQKGSHSDFFVRNGIQWDTIHRHSSLKYVVMMIKPYKVILDSDSNLDSSINEV
ncbi:unnamed protein product [Owenia fusiformis]|uniref:Fibrinogen C-terminal domain-containing protein n=1 Tax=Owenia fusiformis TaxID=6347 RepID=A0A8S4Q761_OWEFU|nr:unnamed protein product [Owenia fusiformis]